MCACFKRIVFGLLLGISTTLAAAAPAGPSSDALRIYFVDVEGGQATLIVSPEGKSFLIDTGYAGDGVGYRPGDPVRARDATRIKMAANDAGVTRIDYLLITHFHDDHDGGVRELSQLMPIDTFVDHGSPHPQVSSNTGVEQLDAFRVYAAVRSGMPHWEPVPGTRLPTKDLKVTVVSSAGAILTQPLPHAGAKSVGCPAQAPPPRDPYENPRSTGVVVEYGKFRFLDMGDLSGEPLFNLVCPRNLIGEIDAYLVPHHGGADLAYPAAIQSFRPRVAIMNNGLKKGGARETFSTLHDVKGLDAVWQLHRSESAGGLNFTPEKTANLDESSSFYLRLTARRDGSFDLFNPRTNARETYGPRG